MKGLIFGCILLLFQQNMWSQELKYLPPWNNPPEAAVNFTINGIDNIPDIYGDVTNPQLVIFFAGNQFMVVPDLIRAFKKEYPQYQRILVETLPPGILAKQIKGGSITIGNMRITNQPDIYTAGAQKMEEMSKEFVMMEPYTRNKLTLLVKKGNPKGIKSLSDLGKPNIRVSMPNPEWEGVARIILTAYERAGGIGLEQRIIKEKVQNGTTFLTQIHHRQSPLRILNDLSDVAPVWHTEVAFQKRKDHPVDEVPIPKALNKIATYFAGILKTAPHPQAAKDFLNFVTSEKGQAIYKKYEFLPLN